MLLSGKPHKLAKPLPLRESHDATWEAKYRLLWRGCDWEPFLLPCKGGFGVARLAPACHASTNQLMDQPGIYELALVKSPDTKRYKVYVGQSCSLRRRFHQEYRGPQGSHLKSFFDEALKNGCEIWKRCRYTATPQDAKKQEAWLLKQFDYAWNTRQAGCSARHVDVRIRRGCCSRSSHLVCKAVDAAPSAHAISAKAGP